ncbi:hypothetical protein KI387_037705, partial [Taxus chinensis]
VGDLVGFAGNPMGSYTEEQILPASFVVPVPSTIYPIVGAAIMLKGMTAQFLLRRCFKVEPRHTILVHAAAGEVGFLLSMGSFFGSEDKDTFQGSLECLAFRGYMVSFGQSSGAIDRVPLSALAPRSLFLTQPSMMQYTATREELLETAGELFANVASGVLRVRVTKTYPLAEAAKAHADLE